MLWKRAECLLEGDDLPAAERSAEAALALVNEINSGERSEVRRVLSRVFRRSGQPNAALEHAAEAWGAQAQNPNPVMRARFAAEYALAHAAAGQTAAARRLFNDHVDPVQLPESAALLREVAEALADL